MESVQSISQTEVGLGGDMEMREILNLCWPLDCVVGQWVGLCETDRKCSVTCVELIFMLSMDSSEMDLSRLWNLDGSETQAMSIPLHFRNSTFAFHIPSLV